MTFDNITECPHCRVAGLFWQSSSEGAALVEHDGSPHECIEGDADVIVVIDRRGQEAPYMIIDGKLKDITP